MLTLTRNSPAISTLLAAGFLLGACGGGSSDPVTRLAALEAEVTHVGELFYGSGGSASVRHDGGGAWIGFEVRDWRTGPVPGSWAADLPLLCFGRPADGAPLARAVHQGRELEFLSLKEVPTGGGVAPGSFTVHGAELFVTVEPGAPAPGLVELERWVPRGVPDARGSRARTVEVAGEGFALWPGERVAVRLDVAVGAELRYAACASSAYPPGAPPAAVRVTARADGAVVDTVELSVGSSGAVVRRRVDLPPGAGVELSFEVEGDAAWSAVVEPIVCPAGPAAREVDSRPDIVIFLADTVRADVLPPWGGREDLAPVVAEFAREGRVYRRSWSTATHTLAAHGAILAGLYPRQVDLATWERALPEDLVTLAEVLTVEGYRTAAITDGLVVSAKAGMDQGFAWFHERDGPDVESTVERLRSFLSSDDGRPTFLYVQSYAAHSPYRVSARTRKALPEFDLPRSFEDVHGAIEGRGGVEHATEEEFELLRGLYLGAVNGLDRLFGDVLAELEAHGRREDTWIVFFSDHGESFGEHDALMHCNAPFEVQARIPLIVQGPGVAPGEVEYAASLIDLPVTVCDIAGAALGPRWEGVSLLSLDRDRPVFVFQCWGPREESRLAAILGDRKLLAWEVAERTRGGELTGAFEFVTDPYEARDSSGDSWVEELAGELLPEAARLLEPLARPGIRGDFDAQRMADMGYASGEDP